MAIGDTRYLYREGEGFQYVCKEDYPFHKALVAQGYTDAASAHADKTRFPGSNKTNTTPNY